MKGYILVDIPKTCYNCHFEVYDEITEENYCVAYNSNGGRMYMLSGSDRPDWCPIKKLPNPYVDVPRYHHDGCIFAEGYNDCLKEILEGD